MENANSAGLRGSLPQLPTEVYRLPKRESDIKKEKRIGHRRVTEEGTVTYKRKTTSEIQRAIQLGIQHSIACVLQKPERDILLRDFGIIETVQFPKEGSRTTPAHPLSDFRFKTYAPVAFRAFRGIFKVDIQDFLQSLCIQDLRELSNPGASGSIFYITEDDEFIIKTVQHKEADFLQKLLPEYYMNLIQHPYTLLPKFYALFCYQCSGKNIRFVVMNNLLPSSIKIHEKYDLKGSTYKRRANSRERAKSSPTLKDLDFREKHPDGILLEGDTYEALMKTIERDCMVLESFRIMDYSMLLGVHNLDQAKRDRRTDTSMRRGDNGAGNSSEPLSRRAGDNILGDQQPPVSAAANDSQSGSPVDTGLSTADVATASGPMGGGVKAAISRGLNRGAGSTAVTRAKSTKRIAAFSTALEAIQATAEPIELESDEIDQIPTGGIPARNSSGDRLLLFVGIIDILQNYRLAKKMEHSFKAIVHDAESVSVTNPNFYAQRFQEAVGQHYFKRVQSPIKHAPSNKKKLLKTRSGAREEDDIGDRVLPSNRIVTLPRSRSSDPIGTESQSTPLRHSTLATNPTITSPNNHRPYSNSSSSRSSVDSVSVPDRLKPQQPAFTRSSVLQPVTSNLQNSVPHAVSTPSIREVTYL